MRRFLFMSVVREEVHHHPVTAVPADLMVGAQAALLSRLLTEGVAVGLRTCGKAVMGSTTGSWSLVVAEDSASQ